MDGHGRQGGGGAALGAHMHLPDEVAAGVGAVGTVVAPPPVVLAPSAFSREQVHPVAES